MTDKCVLHLWAKAQNRPLTGEKNKSILLLSILCNLFAPRGSPDLYTKCTRNTSVIYSTKEEQTKKEKKENQPSQLCFSKYTQRDSSPYASPEGHGTTPFCEMSAVVYREARRSRHAAYGLAPAL